MSKKFLTRLTVGVLACAIPATVVLYVLAGTSLPREASAAPARTASVDEVPEEECVETRIVSARDRRHDPWDETVNEFLEDGFEIAEIRYDHNPNLYVLERECGDWWNPFD